MKWLRRTVWVLLFCVVLPFPMTILGLAAFVTFYEPPEVLPDPATIVILSEGQRRNGKMARQTKVRVQAGLAAYDPGDIILVTGGQLTNHPDSIAEAMAKAVRAAGIEPIVEPRAGSTYQNAIFSARLLAELPDGPILLVTNRYHLPRSWLLFRNAGVDNVTLLPAESAQAHWTQFRLRTLARESLKIFDALWTSATDGSPQHVVGFQ